MHGMIWFEFALEAVVNWGHGFGVSGQRAIPKSSHAFLFNGKRVRQQSSCNFFLLFLVSFSDILFWIMQITHMSQSSAFQFLILATDFTLSIFI